MCSQVMRGPFKVFCNNVVYVYLVWDEVLFISCFQRTNGKKVIDYYSHFIIIRKP